MNATIALSGIRLSASNLPLPDVSTWFAWYYQRNIDYSAGSLVSSSNIVAITYIQEVSIAGNAYFELESQEITASNLPLPDDSTWHDWYYERNLDYSAQAQVSITGISLSIDQQNIRVFVENSEILNLSGNTKRYAANEFKYAKVEIAGISTKISTGAVKAIGSISISARANVQSVGIKSEVPTIYAEGVKWITEDELILMMAA